MGSFNQTCALSGLPIHPGHECKILLLVESPFPPDLIHSNTLVGPLTIAMDANYYDYGRVIPRDKELQGGDFEKDPAWTLWKERLGKEDVLIISEDGSCLTSKEVLTFSYLQDALHDQAIVILDESNQDPLKVFKCLIRQDVWELIIGIPENYSSFLDYRDRKRKSLKEFREDFLASIRINMKLPDETKTLHREWREESNYPFSALAREISTSRFGYSGIPGIREAFRALLEEFSKSDPELSLETNQELISRFLDIYLIENFLASTNRLWLPSLYGNQVGEWEYHLKFHKGLYKILDKVIQEQEEEYGEE